MTEHKTSKNNRILNLYASLCEGKIINKTEQAKHFGVDERSIQRDIDDIRAFLDENKTNKASDNRTIEYDRRMKGFVMTGGEDSVMSNSEILAVSKILLASRAFTKKEIDGILNKLVKGCVPLRNMRLVSELLSNEKYHYVELHHKSHVQDKLWEFGRDIQEHNLLEITYKKAEHTKETVKRLIEPMAVLFSEYYFYLNAFIVEKNKDGMWTHKYAYPAIFRIDRIKAYKETGEKFRVLYADRFEEGEFRKRIQFMYAGELMRIRLMFYGANPEPVLDRLPTAQIIEQGENECIISAEVYGNGILMWLLSQGSRIKVLRPDNLRQEIREKAEEIWKLYS
ncbi:MAG: WYL domain-containing protein [Lachnospiraceae bacterium]|nr:WYL domain-containing protein [Lachnospiraceae bacterium]